MNNSTLHFTPNVNSSALRFDDIIKSATGHIKQLTDARQKVLKEDLENGLGHFSNADQLKMYMASYGDIHREKLLMAFEKLPRKIWVEDKISIVDYGCGQCIAEMVLADYLRSRYIDIDYVSDITLIEPNRISLKQGLEYINGFYFDSKIKPIIANAAELSSDCLHPKMNTVLHIFSNVLDIPDFNHEHISDIINQDMSHNHIIVCVSPFYQENGRGALMDKFGQLLKCFRCEYKFEKHTDEWNKDFSCQIRIFVRGYY